MKDLSKFQIFFFIGILILVVVAALILSGVIPVSRLNIRAKPIVQLTMWGPFSQDVFTEAIFKINDENNDVFSVKYYEKGNNYYEETFVDAMAAGGAPDILIVTQDMILRHQDKFYLAPYQFFPQRSFKDAFIDGSEIYMLKNGIMAVPFLIDPIVLYWNRDLFSKVGLSRPPRFWDEFAADAQMLTEIDPMGNIIRSGTALGDFSNVDNAKELLSLLIMQSGSKIVDPNTLEPSFELKQKAGSNPVEAALRFFTDFSNPSKTSYSWNRSFSDSRDVFAAEKLAMYFGYASDLKIIKYKNPHLNFDVAVVPQIKDSSLELTFGRFYGLAVPKTSHNTGAALSAAFAFAKQNILSGIRDKVFLPAATRTLLAQPVKDSQMAIFNKAAIQSRAWLEPDTKAVFEIFKNMVESVLTGKSNLMEAVVSTRDLFREQLLRFQELQQIRDSAGDASTNINL